MNEQNPAIFLKDLKNWIDMEFGEHGRGIVLMSFDETETIKKLENSFPENAVLKKIPRKIIRKMYESLSKDEDSTKIKNEMWEFLSRLSVMVIPKIH